MDIVFGVCLSQKDQERMLKVGGLGERREWGGWHFPCQDLLFGHVKSRRLSATSRGAEVVCLYACVCVCVCARGDKVALWKGLWEDRASVSPLMQRQGRMTHNRTLNRCGEEKHSDKHTQAQSSPPWGGLIMAGQGVEGGRGQRGRVEKTEEKRE